MRLLRSEMAGHVLLLIGVFAYFLYFVGPAWDVPFSIDDPQNMYQYWSAGPLRIVAEAFRFWSPFVRPLGGLYYWPVFQGFGLNPVAFNVVRIAMLFAAVCCFYSLAWQLSRSRIATVIASVIVAYHGAIKPLAYQGSFVYDILCGGFFFAALSCYLKDRKWLAVVLYVCALDSKEMAVTLPVLVLVWELLKGQEVRRWRPLCVMAGITALFIAGKTWGDDSLTQLAPYAPQFTWKIFAGNSLSFLDEMFYTTRFSQPWMLRLWAAVLLFGIVMATWARDRRFLWLWTWIIVTPLPVAFLPRRGGPVLFIVLAGWALLAGLLTSEFARALSRWTRIPARVTKGCAAGFLLSLYLWETARHPVTFGVARQTTAVMESIRRLPFRPAPQSSVIFLNDPFEAFDTLFIASLVWNDHSLSIQLQNHSHLTEEALDDVDYVLDFRPELRLVRGPK